jgi:hypothetical protein
MLSNNFDNDFWSRTTLQMAFSEPAVRHALIALGYLHSTETGSMKHARSRFAGQRESGILLEHYNKSVRGLVDRMGQTTYSPEIGLVTCLLFVCMEFLRGNYHTAFTHLTNGLKIVSGYRDKERHYSPTASSSTLLYGSPTTSTPSSSTLIEHELKPIFDRAIASAMMYGVDVDDSVETSPPSLQYYQGLHFQNVRQIQLSAHRLRNESIFLIRDLSRKLLMTPDEPLTTEDLVSQQSMLTCQRAWFSALETYENTHQPSKTEQLMISVTVSQWYATNIWASCVTEIRQTAFDEHLPAFRTMLHHCKLILDSMELAASQPAARFTFEISIIPVLYFVGQRCRCPTTRREAVALLDRNPPREGLWDAKQHAIVTRRLIEIEEEELDPLTGWPVEEKRLWSNYIDANMDQKGGFWAYFLRTTALREKKPGENPVLIQEFMTLYV